MSRMQRAWHAVRRDIGRKLTAVALALGLWFTLQKLVTMERSFTLDLRVVASQQEADRDAPTGGAIYVIVPPELIVTSGADASVEVTVLGLRTDVEGLKLSVLLPIGMADLGGADAALVSRTLTRESFRFQGVDGAPQITRFRVRPDTLSIGVAKLDRATIGLSSQNLAFLGRPKEGYSFFESRITMRPSQVEVEGPRAVIDSIRQNASLLKLAPVNVGGKQQTVVEQVELASDLLAKLVRLRTADGKVEVTVPITADDVSVEVLGVPIVYRNEAVLAARNQRVVSATATRDVRLLGPASELSGTAEFQAQLKEKFWLGFDWKSTEGLDRQANAKVLFLRHGLSRDVRIRNLEDTDEPRIEYTLGPLVEGP